MNTDIENLFKDKVLGHPAGLFIVFFTEMWERFSFYGMRVLLVLFLTAPLIGENPGWAAWQREHAMALFGTYASLLYLTPILGGFIADKFMGYKWAVTLGCFVMTLGHISMAFETELTLYLGLALLIIGTGLFKPNIASIISEMYKGNDAKKDGAYTIFYMGVNAGAFFGIMLCGYLGENYSWALGFGLAGIFMFLGTIMFWLAQNLFGSIGSKPKNDSKDTIIKDEEDVLNPFSIVDKILIVVSATIGFIWLINDPMSKIASLNLFDFTLGDFQGATVMIVFAILLFLYLIISRIVRYSHTVRDRMFAVAIFAFFTIFFWAAFEQAAGSLNIFARDYMARELTGFSATLFKIVDAVLTVVPLIFITWVLFLVFRKTFSKIAVSNMVLSISFLIIWGIVLWKLNNEFNKDTTEVPATWFGILNSFFIIALAPLFSKWWESKYNPSVAFKYGFGLALLGLGFALLAYGSIGIPQGAKSASVSMVWLIFAYLFHTLGELCLSPVGLSYLSKLVPGRMIAFMFGIWYLAIAIGQKAAGTLGGMIDEVTANYNLATFFLLFTIVPIGAGIVIIMLNPLLKRLMHGVR